MATRTFKLTGTSTAATTITVTFNGSQVFSGTANTNGVLCEFTADSSVTGNTATTVTVNSGEEVVVSGLKANYVIYERAEYVNADGETVPAVTADDVTTTFDYLDGSDGVYASASSMSNASINSEAVEINADPGGLWKFMLHTDDVLSADYFISDVATAPA